MNIIVCVKQVADITIQSGYDPDTDGMVSEGMVYILNPHDEIATEEAIRQKEIAGGGAVTVVTIGPPPGRRCLTMVSFHGSRQRNTRAEQSFGKSRSMGHGFDFSRAHQGDGL